MSHTSKAEAVASSEQRSFFMQATKEGDWSPRGVQRANMLLLADVNGPDALPDDTIASRLRCSVAIRRKRFAQLSSV